MMCSRGHEFDNERIHHLSFIRDERGLSKDLPYSLLVNTKNQLQSLLVSSRASVATPKLSVKSGRNPDSCMATMCMSRLLWKAPSPQNSQQSAVPKFGVHRPLLGLVARKS